MCVSAIPGGPGVMVSERPSLLRAWGASLA